MKRMLIGGAVVIAVVGLSLAIQRVSRIQRACEARGGVRVYAEGTGYTCVNRLETKAPGDP